MNRLSPQTGSRRGFSLLELIVIVTVMGILVAVLVPRFGTQSQSARKNGCAVNRTNIQVQCQLWRRQKGTAPQANLADIGSNTNYFPEGLPVCPVDGSVYSINTTTLTVVGHAH